MKFHHIWGVKQKNSPYMLRIIVFCAVKIANREKETETRKGDRIDDQTRTGKGMNVVNNVLDRKSVV